MKVDGKAVKIEAAKYLKFEWIACSERLPDLSVPTDIGGDPDVVGLWSAHVLILVNGYFHDGLNDFIVARLNHTPGWIPEWTWHLEGLDDSLKLNKVKYWCPIPEPPTA